MDEYMIRVKKALIQKIDIEKVISRAELARQLNVSKPTVTIWLQEDKETGIDAKYFLPICEILKISPNYLFGYQSSMDVSEDDIMLINNLNSNPKLKDLIKKSFEDDKLKSLLVNLYDMQGK